MNVMHAETQNDLSSFRKWDFYNAISHVNIFIMKGVMHDVY